MKYERKYEEICGKYENKDSPYTWAEGLRRISRSSSYLGRRGGREWFDISRFRGTPEKRHETCQKKRENMENSKEGKVRREKQKEILESSKMRKRERERQTGEREKEPPSLGFGKTEN